MTRLPHDYARCGSGDSCPRAHKCLRWLDPGRGAGQTFTLYDPDTCSSFISAEEIER